ncbi:MAG TPA: sterol desaturase family protein [Burkholderiaceae bacterium]|nr:sterol desaturase family protein [Burkholderiaceae bacterium]
MSSSAIADESLLRLGAFLLVFLVMALWEALAPRRRQTFERGARWWHNIGLLLLDVALLRVLAPGAAIAVALAGEAHGWGLVNALALPAWIAVPLAFVLLDLVIYFQHVMFHAVPTLWRLHRVHHTDLDFDVTTGTRFHPIEILVSTGIKCAAVAAIGAPAIAVLGFELLLNATATFNHANARLPLALDRMLRWLVVTPDMHRVHHSAVYNETNSNFGFNLPWWDRVFGTYRAQPAAGHEAMTIGVDAFRSRAELRLDQLLLQPFRETPGGYAINRRPEPPIDIHDSRDARHAS